MGNVPPPAEELALLDRELARLDARRSVLLARRAWLVSVLSVPASVPVPGPVPPSRGAVAARAETSPRGARNVLLSLGGALLGIAAVAFTLVSWGHMGIGGRAAVLTAVTVAALAVPVPLVRRGLGATAETVAVLGLVLMVLDALALYLVTLSEMGGVAYAAVVSAVLATVWAGYGTVVAGPRTPRPAAVVAAQLPLPLWALAADAGGLTVAWALLATAAADVAVALWVRSASVAGVRVVAWTAAAAAGGWAVLVGGALSVVDGGAGPAVLLLVASGVAVAAAWRVASSSAAVACASAAGLVAVVGAGGLVREALPTDWVFVAYVLCAVVVAAVAAAVRGVAPRGVAPGLAGASAAVQGLAAAWALVPVVAALAAPAVTAAAVWSGAVPSGPGVPWQATVVSLLVAGCLAAVRGVVARSGAVALAWVTALSLPSVWGAGYAATLVAQSLVTFAAVALAVRPEAAAWRLRETVGTWNAGGSVGTGGSGGADGAGGADGSGDSEGARGASRGAGAARVAPVTVLARVALGCGIASAVVVLLPALAREAATLAVLGVLGALFAGAAALAGGGTRALSAGVAGVAVTGLVAAAAAAGGLPAHQVALALLVVPASAALLGARLRHDPAGLPVEGVGVAAALSALGLAADRPAVLALALGLCGVIAAATAVRPERRRVAGYTAAGLFVAASWVRLAVWDVSAPEAYALPVAVPALVVGVLRARRDPEVSSWTAYGPGLAAGLFPALVAAWADTQWPRPLLLGLVALGVTLVGARLRLAAPLLLGGAVLLLVGAHELAPYVVQAVGVLPRWLPPALAGVLLLAVGATYEQRLRDVRRLRETVGRMR
ncbi:SCO7613 C-terminal domain-containing membrane protein [Streptomyces sp. NPDC047928]|uniref:SCO7613 C-terminal domain-containing membrane protein n=1 Tax=unclassified Streptomyces TaxID=2593676 RepID=UPI003720DE28